MVEECEFLIHEVSCIYRYGFMSCYQYINTVVIQYKPASSLIWTLLPGGAQVVRSPFAVQVGRVGVLLSSGWFVDPQRRETQKTNKQTNKRLVVVSLVYLTKVIYS